MHIKRMEPFLKRQNINYTIFDFGSLRNDNVIPTNKSIFWYLKILFNRKFDVFHFHQIFLFEYIFYFVFSKINKTTGLVTIHSESLFTSNTILRNLSLFFLKRSKFKVLAVSKNLHDLLNKKNIETVFLPAYVPPVEVSLVSIKKDGRIYFLYSVWKISKKLSEEIYNIPLAFQFLKNNKEKFKMLFLVGNKDISDIDYLNKLISEYDLANDVEILFGKNLITYVQNCSFLLKTNKVDGYGVALQEAMDLGVPAIASDVCVRPKGTVLFKDNDIDDLSQKVNATLARSIDDILAEKEELGYHLELINIYKNLINKE